MSGAAQPGAVFGCLADANRRAIVDQLAENPATATELAASMHLTRQGISKHLTLLEQAGVLRTERDGRQVRYHVNPGPVRDAAAWLDAKVRGWDRQLDVLRRAAERG